MTCSSSFLNAARRVVPIRQRPSAAEAVGAVLCRLIASDTRCVAFSVRTKASPFAATAR